MEPIIVIGRGHGGTRAIAKTLVESGVHMGKLLRRGSYDTLPPDRMYDAARIAGTAVRSPAPNTWDFEALVNHEPPAVYKVAVEDFLENVDRRGRWGWKLPETLLSFPWLRQLFPRAYYIYWRRDPQDALRQSHLTDRLDEWNVLVHATSLEEHRTLSYIYQEQIVRSSLEAQGTPERFIEVRFEDFVLNQDATLRELEAFLGFPLAKIGVYKSAVGRPNPFPFHERR
jgi:hypothetical protein